MLVKWLPDKKEVSKSQNVHFPPSIPFKVLVGIFSLVGIHLNINGVDIGDEHLL